MWAAVGVKVEVGDGCAVSVDLPKLHEGERVALQALHINTPARPHAI